ncbi:MAG: M23 family metallopeptidase [Verrucomicrobia bacterium]|nr:M23 family metallopeptidase [Verrucomicrobiota bacterium]
MNCIAQAFSFPTANRALLESDGEEKFFVGTVGKSWASGIFGCVRTDGQQFHEGLDVRCLQRDRRGEPIDPVLAAADGTVVYVNHKPGLSNYGQYVIVRHLVEGLEIYSVYAHLSEVREGIASGREVRLGEHIAIMGRSTNTRQGISKDRAHVHFELNLLANERFPEWYRNNFPDQRNDHGRWNGQNLLGVDPRLVLLSQEREGGRFRFLEFLRNQTELCRVVVRTTSFPWLLRYTPLIRRNRIADQEGVAGYEIALNYTGLPFQLIPRSASEIAGRAQTQLLSVNEAEQAKHPCAHLVTKRGGRWELTRAGLRRLDLITY